jgi:hypothetical protein
MTTTQFDRENVDCVEEQDDCIASCQLAANRNYAVIALEVKNGKACAGPTDCKPGQGTCVTEITPTTGTDASSEETSSIGGIIGGVLAAAILIGIVAYVAVLRKRKPEANPHLPNVNPEGLPPAFIGVVFDSPAGDSGHTKVTVVDELATDPTVPVALHYRFLEPEPSATAVHQGKLRIPKDYRPAADCRTELLNASGSLLMPQMEVIVNDVTDRLEREGVARDSKEYNKRFAFYAYTYEAANLKKDQQLYAVLNAMLRSREKSKFKAWTPFIYYLNKALDSLPNIETTVYKGMWNAKDHVDKYDGTNVVQWSGYSSTSTDIEVAKKFAGPNGLVLYINVRRAKNVQSYSWFGEKEAELMLSPNMEFQTSPPSKKYPEQGKRRFVEGRTYINLLEIPGGKIYS